MVIATVENCKIIINHKFCIYTIDQEKISFHSLYSLYSMLLEFASQNQKLEFPHPRVIIRVNMQKMHLESAFATRLLD